MGGFAGKVLACTNTAGTGIGTTAATIAELIRCRSGKVTKEVAGANRSITTKYHKGTPGRCGKDLAVGTKVVINDTAAANAPGIRAVGMILLEIALQQIDL